ncbi:hypothetical protein TIFTF001_038017 [Ficus carica]|uniref:Uncharacterized protein n=1 Tax=Ficus carica TaxID=3494 RepID=A0AA88E6H1_FICCA|nr:hypothetical protein TIFTF001_038017 [Ficus carica]
MFTKVKPPGKNKTSRMLCRADLPQRQVSNLPAISDAILWRAGAADCEIKLPLVVPIHIKSGLVYNLIMMAFKEGLKVRYLRKYLSVSDDPAWEVGALQVFFDILYTASACFGHKDHCTLDAAVNKACKDSQGVLVEVINYCQDCSAIINLSKIAFSEIADLKVGRVLIN